MITLVKKYYDMTIKKLTNLINLQPKLLKMDAGTEMKYEAASKMLAACKDALEAISK